MIPLNKIRSKFREAFATERGGGTAYIVHCWTKIHRNGGERFSMEIAAETTEDREEGVFHCHNCKHSGSIYTEFPDDFSRAENDLAVKTSDRPISVAQESTTRFRHVGDMWGGVLAPGAVLPLAMVPRNSPPIEYLAGRGFDIDELFEFNHTGDIRGLFYCTNGQIPISNGMGTMSGRIIIPIYGEEMTILPNGQVAPCPVLRGWQARRVEVIDKEKGEKKVWVHGSWRTFKKKDGVWEDRHVPKYYTSPGFHKSRVLGGLQHAKGSPVVAVVEGPLDYYRTGRHCVYTMGDSMSEDQIRQIKAYWKGPDNLVVMLRDPEVDTTSKSFHKMLVALEEPPKVNFHHFCLEGDKDPGATARDETWRQIAGFVGDPHLQKYAK